MVNESILSLVIFGFLIVVQKCNVAAYDGIRDWTGDDLALENTIAAWFVKDPNTNVVCILFQGGIRIAVNGSLIDVPIDASASGDCGSEIQTLNVEWRSGEGATNNLSFNFLDIRDRYIFPVSKTSYILESINGNLYSINNATKPISFSIREGMIRYYIDMDSSCYSQDVIRAIDETVEVQFIDVRLEAFHSSPDYKFSYSSGNCFGTNAAFSLFLMSLTVSGLIIIVIILVVILIGKNTILGRRNSIEGYSRIQE